MNPSESTILNQIILRYGFVLKMSQSVCVQIGKTLHYALYEKLTEFIVKLLQTRIGNGSRRVGVFSQPCSKSIPLSRLWALSADSHLRKPGPEANKSCHLRQTFCKLCIAKPLVMFPSLNKGQFCGYPIIPFSAPAVLYPVAHTYIHTYIRTYVHTF